MTRSIPARFHSHWNSTAPGSSDAAIRNSATPSVPLSPPRSFTMFTRKFTTGMMAVSPKKPAPSMAVNAGLFFRMYSAEWARPALRAAGASVREKRGNAAVESSSRTTSPAWVTSTDSMPKRRTCWPARTETMA